MRYYKCVTFSQNFQFEEAHNVLLAAPTIESIMEHMDFLAPLLSTHETLKDGGVVNVYVEPNSRAVRDPIILDLGCEVAVISFLVCLLHLGLYVHQLDFCLLLRNA